MTDLGRTGWQPTLRTFVLLALPALLYLPMEWARASSRPPATLWYLADRGRLVFLLAVPCLIIMLFAWSRFQPRTNSERAIAVALTVFTAIVAFIATPVGAMILGL